MEPLLTVIRREPWDVQPRLNEIGVNLPGLLRVASQARGEAANQTPFHALNFGGTMAYQYGSFYLRQEFVPLGWAVDRPRGVEAILNVGNKMRIVFANVDVCCNDAHQPRARSEKGSGAERLCAGNLFETLPHYALAASVNEATFYLMCGDNGATELSRPLVKNKKFSGYLERNYLSFGTDFADALPSFDTDDAVAGFDPQVARK